jgi:hypothetical protein
LEGLFIVKIMVETENIYFNSHELWAKIRSISPEALIPHEKELASPKINVCMVFCPLYAHGELSDSKIIFPPDEILDSRVAGKFEAYMPVINSMQKYLKDFGGGIDLTAVFANKGVILSDEPQDKHKEALDYHAELYKNAMNELSKTLEIPVNFYDYESLGVNFPQFYNPQKAVMPENIYIEPEMRPESQMINALNQYFGDHSPIEDNKTNRKVVKSILQFKGTSFEAAFWLIAGYLAFDPKIPDLIGENGVYLVSERADSLFWISKLTSTLDKLTRVQVKVT